MKINKKTVEKQRKKAEKLCHEANCISAQLGTLTGGFLSKILGSTFFDRNVTSGGLFINGYTKDTCAYLGGRDFLPRHFYMRWHARVYHKGELVLQPGYPLVYKPGSWEKEIHRLYKKARTIERNKELSKKQADLAEEAKNLGLLFE